MSDIDQLPLLVLAICAASGLVGLVLGFGISAIGWRKPTPWVEFRSSRELWWLRRTKLIDLLVVSLAATAFLQTAFDFRSSIAENDLGWMAEVPWPEGGYPPLSGVGDGQYPCVYFVEGRFSPSNLHETNALRSAYCGWLKDFSSLNQGRIQEWKSLEFPSYEGTPMDVEQVRVIFLRGGDDHITHRLADYEARQDEIAKRRNAAVSGGANTPTFFWALIAGAMAVGLALSKIFWMKRFTQP